MKILCAYSRCCWWWSQSCQLKLFFSFTQCNPGLSQAIIAAAPRRILTLKEEEEVGRKLIASRSLARLVRLFFVFNQSFMSTYQLFSCLEDYEFDEFEFGKGSSYLLLKTAILFFFLSNFSNPHIMWERAARANGKVFQFNLSSFIFFPWSWDIISVRRARRCFLIKNRSKMFSFQIFN